MNFARQLTRTSYILIFLILQVILVTALLYGKQRVMLQYKTQVAGEFQNHYKATLAHHRELADLFFSNNINTPQNIELLQQLSSSSEEKQSHLRKQLQDFIQPEFEKNRQIFRQLHFHRPDGTSFLRMHKSQLYGDNLLAVRESIEIIISEHQFVEGLEVGRHYVAVRYIYPLFTDNGNYIGSVELGVPFYHFSRHLNGLNPGVYTLLVKEEIVTSKMRTGGVDNFITSGISQDLVLEKADIVDLHKKVLLGEHGLITPTDLFKLDQNIKQRVGGNRGQHLPFTLSTVLKGQDYQITFLPLASIADHRLGYLVRYNKTEIFSFIEHGFVLAYFMGTGFIVALCLLYWWSTNKIFNQLHFVRHLINAIPSPLFYTNSDGTTLTVNTAFVDSFLKADQQEEPANMLKQYPLAMLPEPLQHLGLEEQGSLSEQEMMIPDDDNAMRYFYASKTKYQRPTAEYQGNIVTLFDISKRKHAEQELSKSHREIEQIFNTAADGMRVVDVDHNVLRVNNRFVEMSGISREELLNKKCFELFGGTSCQTDSCPLARILAGETRIEVETNKQFASGRQFSCIVTATPYHDHNGEIVGIVEDFKDISERKVFEAKLRQLSFTDELSGIMNRRGFLESSEKLLQLARRQKKTVILLFADLDNMKMINDTLGHKQGDLAIMKTADLLQETYRETDTIGRLGGDEFAVLLYDVEEHDISQVLARFEEKLAQWNKAQQYAFSLALSVGLVTYDLDADEGMEQFLNRADQAMYAVKKSRKA